VAERIPGALIVIAKTPRPGHVKTRLTPPLSAEEVCAVAWACLSDTLAAAAAVPSRRHVLLLAGEPGSWAPESFEIIPQVAGGLGERLAAGFDAVADDAIVIAMDTPQVDPATLTRALRALGSTHDTVLGPAADGGYWLLGLRGHINRFSHTVINVSDLERAVEFYEATFPVRRRCRINGPAQRYSGLGIQMGQCEGWVLENRKDAALSVVWLWRS